MKKIFSLIVLLAGVISFTSCGDEDASYNPIPKLEVANANVLFEAEGGSGTITVNTSSAVTATTESTWLTVAVNGNTVTATAPLNSSLNGRSAKITIKSGDAQAVVTATQKGSVYGIDGDLVYSLSDTEGSAIGIPVVHTSGVTVQSLTEWLTASFNSETSEIEVVAASNDDESARYGFVAFETGAIKDTLLIVQSGMVFLLDKTSLAVSNAGGVEAVTIEHSKPVTIESDATWFECSFNNETGILSVAVDENSTLARQGSIVVKSGSVSKTITVIQYDPASLADQIVGNYYFTYYDAENKLSAFAATLTEEALQLPALGWSIPVTIDKEKLTVSINSGNFVGTYNYQGMPLYMYLLFVDETDEKWSGNKTDVVASAVLGLEDIGGGNLTLAGDFAGTLASGDKIGSFLFSAMLTQTLDVSDDNNYLGNLLQMYAPGLMKIPAEEGTEAPAMIRRASLQPSNMSLPLKKHFKK